MRKKVYMQSKAEKIAQGLHERHIFFKELYGEDWPAEVRKWAPHFIIHAAIIDDYDILSVGLSISKRVADNGMDPNIVFAITAELLLRNFPLKRNVGWGSLRFIGFFQSSAPEALFRVEHAIGEHPAGSTISTGTARAILLGRRAAS